MHTKGETLGVHSLMKLKIKGIDLKIFTVSTLNKMNNKSISMYIKNSNAITLEIFLIFFVISNFRILEFIDW